MKTWVKVLIVLVIVVLGVGVFFYFYPPKFLYIIRTEHIVDGYFSVYAQIDDAVDEYLAGRKGKLNRLLDELEKYGKQLSHIHPPPGAKLDFVLLNKAHALTLQYALSRVVRQGDLDLYYMLKTKADNAWDDWREERERLKK